ncbi:hypothetical protein [Natrarchaeobius chitinivorans]|nr:hypothetical protein [Natrarchaeobius chitinivorans]
MQYDEFIGEEAVTESALDDIRGQLPADEGYDDLFEIAEQEGTPA